ncbi:MULTISPECIES: hypothetical protein [unclassified Lentimonas]|uniref:hypothetical protein n=1 Tax=unclassified Lentimonas TaxID=2630993 RepID=UPI00132AB99F|nr:MULTISPECIES: hypothetical protein [unclassified Lentimonas]CAA6693472.1 Unannotated [Lentimonas sp. CC19]CAA6695821.1 Unannotated [Lentimonas sp. CC10]CAA7069742.1 Unannotated [Lentimonas sp. CC11]
MKKITKYILVPAAILGLFALNFYADRIREAELLLETSEELQKIGVEFSHIREEEKLRALLEGREFQHIRIQNIEILPHSEKPQASDALLLYREPGKSFIFHLDGHVTVKTKKT